MLFFRFFLDLLLGSWQGNNCDKSGTKVAGVCILTQRESDVRLNVAKLQIL